MQLLQHQILRKLSNLFGFGRTVLRLSCPPPHSAAAGSIFAFIAICSSYGVLRAGFRERCYARAQGFDFCSGQDRPPRRYCKVFRRALPGLLILAVQVLPAILAGAVDPGVSHPSRPFRAGARESAARPSSPQRLSQVLLLRQTMAARGRRRPALARGRRPLSGAWHGEIK